MSKFNMQEKFDKKISGSKTQYDKVGHDFAKNKKEFFEKEVDFAREFILRQLIYIEGKNILDVGCGAGDDIANYEKMKFKSVFGIDPSKIMVEKTRAVSQHPERIKIGDYENTGLPDASIDFITGRFSLHYVENFDKAYQELARVLKSGGILALSVDHPVADAVEGEHFMHGTHKYVRIKLYKGSVTLEFPQHNFSDYLSPTFLRLFEITTIEEHTGKDREYQDGPNALAFAACRR